MVVSGAASAHRERVRRCGWRAPWGALGMFSMYRLLVVAAALIDDAFPHLRTPFVQKKLSPFARCWSGPTKQLGTIDIDVITLMYSPYILCVAVGRREPNTTSSGS